MAAIARGQHRLLDPQPWILDDPFGLLLVGPSWPRIHAAMSTTFPAPVIRRAIAFAVGRSRYAEDRLLQGTFAQYVILGAGLDSFAWRRPDVLNSLRVFEVDHPATQSWKKQRAEVLALPTHANHIFVPVDFESETLKDGLDSAGFDWNSPAFFSWLGVTPYLRASAITATLKTVAACAPGSEVVLTYGVVRAFSDKSGSDFGRILARVAAESGEQIQTLLSPEDAVTLIEGSSLRVVEHLTTVELHERYFSRRNDQLTPHTSERLIAAVVQK